VGRQRELELVLDAFARSEEGRGQALSLAAEAGEGKSRHLYEFRKVVANEDVTFLEGKCLSYSRGVAYHPIVDILKGNFDIREGDDDEVIREKVQRGLKILEVDEARRCPTCTSYSRSKTAASTRVSSVPRARRTNRFRH
jgi:predicted ATPase